jgi:molecular chaperone GrpE
MNEDTATSAAPDAAFAPDAASRNGGEENLAAELAAARAEAKENYDKFLYAMADFENYKKRIERDLSRIALDGRKAVLRKVLPVLDNLERALAFEDSDAVRGGLQATLRMFETALATESVKAVSLKGRPKRSPPNPRPKASLKTRSSKKPTRPTPSATKYCAPPQWWSPRTREL